MRFPAIGLAVALVLAAPAVAQVQPAPSPSQGTPVNLDTDNDGEVAYLEYIAPAIAMFERLDKDKSGTLSKDELGDQNLIVKAPEPAER